MSRNGSGVFTLVSGNPVVTGTTIASTWANNTLSDIASALTDSVAADGQTAMTGNLNLNSNKIVNLATPTLSTDAVTKAYADSVAFTIAPSTAGNVLTSNGTAWVSQAPAAFDAGTRLIFAQTTAPTGWTKDTTNYNNHALRVVTGSASTGGTVDFTSAFVSQAVSGTVGTSGATTLSTAQMPSHSHSVNTSGTNGGCPGSNSGPYGSSTGAEGGGGSHTHSGGTFTGTAINLAVKYLDVITATKN
jgi:hypothetical protein